MVDVRGGFSIWLSAFRFYQEGYGPTLGFLSGRPHCNGRTARPFAQTVASHDGTIKPARRRAPGLGQPPVRDGKLKERLEILWGQFEHDSTTEPAVSGILVAAFRGRAVEIPARILDQSPVGRTPVRPRESVQYCELASHIQLEHN